MTRAGSVGIMQPYLLPYIGYFALLASVETFVVFDSAQYISRGWVNRNRLPSPGPDGWAYFQIPVRSAPRETAICDIRIAHDGKWQPRLRRTIEERYRKSPQFAAVLPLLAPLWEPHELLLDPLEATLRSVSAYLGLSPRFVRSSAIESAEQAALPGEERILGLCRALGATDYWNLPGGADVYHPEKFSAAGTALHFVPALDVEKWRSRFPGLSAYSIIDVLMRASPEEVRRMLVDVLGVPEPLATQLP